ncbi:SusD/RagB family nutrient-binding outer membrane lipoprotein [Terrimonas pollutisoli]|uniref:SusD/RagB family nutrient-binding outer membrane lipoprotein n=1 Tax=Terrimonas pollutisoli TaxID=3034147 RepID=UPI0023EDFA21|nr:SusD/RagB family nutrient-binding outer membrane lipoprotein [Terrimonas sp. H1YJ31]
MKRIISVFFITTSLLVLGGCAKKFDQYFQDPNRPESVPAALVLNGILNDLSESAWNSTQGWNQFYCYNYNYYGNQEYNWTTTGLNYTTLKNVIKMEEEAKKGGGADVNPYAALGKFFRAYFFYLMTSKVGDLPMKDALQGLESQTPKYDTQKEIFVQILKWLDEANNDLTQLIAAADVSLLGDFYNNNNLGKWQKVVNAFKLRVLISLSKKEGDAELGIKAKFAELIGNSTKYPIMTGMADNLEYVYNPPFNKYPKNPDNYGFETGRLNMSATHLNTLASLKDPRTFIVAEPAQKKVASGISPTDHAAFVGASPAEDLADMSTKALAGEYSFISRKRYYNTYAAEKIFQIAYPEMCFNIAEGINRGWVTGDAEEWYKKGIMASIGFYGITNGANTVYFHKVNTGLGNFDTYTINVDLDAYYNQTSVKYAGNNATGLSQVLTQKYLAFFQNSGWEAFFNYRRTGMPAFAQGGSGTGNSGVIPKRFLYPTSERTTNEANLKEALQRQFSGDDNINSAMWLIQ